MLTTFKNRITHPLLRGAYEIWCEETGTEPGDFEDGDWHATVDVLSKVFLIKQHLSGVFSSEQPEQGALVLAASGVYAGLSRRAPAEAASIVAGIVDDSLGVPTGYEGEPDRLARVIHQNLVAVVDTRQELVRTLMEQTIIGEHVQASVMDLANQNWLLKTVVETALRFNDVNTAVFATLSNTAEHNYFCADLPGGGYAIHRSLD